MTGTVYDHMLSIVIVGAIFAVAVIVVPNISYVNLLAVDQQQLRNIALDAFKAMLLGIGYPADWGSIDPFDLNSVQKFGLASVEDSSFYVLDPDKVQRLVIGNPLGYLTYDEMRALLELQDYGFSLRIIPPFNVTNTDGTSMTPENPPIELLGDDEDILHYEVKVSYLDGRPIPNAVTRATIVYSTGEEGSFEIARPDPVSTDALGLCEDDVTLSLGGKKNPQVVVILRISVADVATLVVSFGTTPSTDIANINFVGDNVILTSTKDPPDYNEPPNENIWVDNVVAVGSQDSLLFAYNGTRSQDDKFNTGQGTFRLWNHTSPGLHDYDPAVFIFSFWAVDTGRQEVFVAGPYQNLLGHTIFQYGGAPSSGATAVRLQRSVIISGMTYTAELTLWKESP